MDIQFEIPTWDEIYIMLLNLADKIRLDNFRLDVIVGISRGGWPPATVMSDLLENPTLANVKVEFYIGISETEKKPILTQPVSLPIKGKKALLIDDVVDTGKSLQLVKQHILSRGASEIKSASIFYKPWSIVLPDYYEKKTRNWIVFPWERKETVNFLIRECKKVGISLERAKKKLIDGGMCKVLVERFFNEVVKEER